MKRFVLICLSVLVFTLTSCDPWKMSAEVKEGYIQTFLEYLKSDEYGEMYYFKIIDESENYTIEDGVMITDENYIENIFRTDVWKTGSGFYILDSNSDLELYYRDNTLYAYDVINNTKTFTSYESNDFEYDTEYNSFLDILFLILNESNYDRYVKSVKGISDPTEHRLIFTFDEDKLKEDGIINDDETLDLGVNIDLENSIYGFGFRIGNRFDTTAISFERSVEMSYVNKRFPDDLNDYVEEVE